MTPQQDKPKRWRPRFSVRTLAIVVTLVCCYAACWGPTKTRGVGDVASHVRSQLVRTTDNVSRIGVSRAFLELYESATAPLIVGIKRPEWQGATRHYYFWFFGYVAKLPYEREVGSSRLPLPTSLPGPESQ